MLNEKTNNPVIRLSHALSSVKYFHGFHTFILPQMILSHQKFKTITYSV